MSRVSPEKDDSGNEGRSSSEENKLKKFFNVKDDDSSVDSKDAKSKQGQSSRSAGQRSKRSTPPPRNKLKKFLNVQDSQSSARRKGKKTAQSSPAGKGSVKTSSPTNKMKRFLNIQEASSPKSLERKGKRKSPVKGNKLKKFLNVDEDKESSPRQKSQRQKTPRSPSHGNKMKRCLNVDDDKKESSPVQKRKPKSPRERKKTPDGSKMKRFLNLDEAPSTSKTDPDEGKKPQKKGKSKSEGKLKRFLNIDDDGTSSHSPPQSPRKAKNAEARRKKTPQRSGKKRRRSLSEPNKMRRFFNADEDQVAQSPNKDGKTPTKGKERSKKPATRKKEGRDESKSPERGKKLKRFLNIDEEQPEKNPQEKVKKPKKKRKREVRFSPTPAEKLKRFLNVGEAGSPSKEQTSGTKDEHAPAEKKRKSPREARKSSRGDKLKRFLNVGEETPSDDKEDKKNDGQTPAGKKMGKSPREMSKPPRGDKLKRFLNVDEKAPSKERENKKGGRKPLREKKEKSSRKGSKSPQGDKLKRFLNIGETEGKKKKKKTAAPKVAGQRNLKRSTPKGEGSPSQGGKLKRFFNVEDGSPTPDTDETKTKKSPKSAARPKIKTPVPPDKLMRFLNIKEGEKSPQAEDPKKAKRKPTAKSKKAKPPAGDNMTSSPSKGKDKREVPPSPTKKQVPEENKQVDAVPPLPKASSPQPSSKTENVPPSLTGQKGEKDPDQAPETEIPPPAPKKKPSSPKTMSPSKEQQKERDIEKKTKIAPAAGESKNEITPREPTPAKTEIDNAATAVNQPEIANSLSPPAGKQRKEIISSPEKSKEKPEIKLAPTAESEVREKIAEKIPPPVAPKPKEVSPPKQPPSPLRKKSITRLPIPNRSSKEENISKSAAPAQPKQPSSERQRKSASRLPVAEKPKLSKSSTLIAPKKEVEKPGRDAKKIQEPAAAATQWKPPAAKPQRAKSVTSITGGKEKIAKPINVIVAPVPQEKAAAKPPAEGQQKEPIPVTVKNPDKVSKVEPTVLPEKKVPDAPEATVPPEKKVTDSPKATAPPEKKVTESPKATVPPEKKVADSPRAAGPRSPVASPKKSLEERVKDRSPSPETEAPKKPVSLKNPEVATAPVRVKVAKAPKRFPKVRSEDVNSSTLSVRHKIATIPPMETGQDASSGKQQWWPLLDKTRYQEYHPCIHRWMKEHSPPKVVKRYPAPMTDEIEKLSQPLLRRLLTLWISHADTFSAEKRAKIMAQLMHCGFTEEQLEELRAAERKREENRKRMAEAGPFDVFDADGNLLSGKPNRKAKGFPGVKKKSEKGEDEPGTSSGRRQQQAGTPKSNKGKKAKGGTAKSKKGGKTKSSKGGKTKNQKGKKKLGGKTKKAIKKVGGGKINKAKSKGKKTKGKKGAKPKKVKQTKGKPQEDPYKGFLAGKPGQLGAGWAHFMGTQLLVKAIAFGASSADEKFLSRANAYFDVQATALLQIVTQALNIPVPDKNTSSFEAQIGLSCLNLTVWIAQNVTRPGQAIADEDTQKLLTLRGGELVLKKPKKKVQEEEKVEENGPRQRRWSELAFPAATSGQDSQSSWPPVTDMPSGVSLRSRLEQASPQPDFEKPRKSSINPFKFLRSSKWYNPKCPEFMYDGPRTIPEGVNFPECDGEQRWELESFPEMYAQPLTPQPVPKFLPNLRPCMQEGNDSWYIMSDPQSYHEKRAQWKTATTVELVEMAFNIVHSMVTIPELSMKRLLELVAELCEAIQISQEEIVSPEDQLLDDKRTIVLEKLFVGFFGASFRDYSNDTADFMRVLCQQVAVSIRHLYDHTAWKLWRLQQCREPSPEPSPPESIDLGPVYDPAAFEEWDEWIRFLQGGTTAAKHWLAWLQHESESDNLPEDRSVLIAQAEQCLRDGLEIQSTAVEFSERAAFLPPANNRPIHAQWTSLDFNDFEEPLSFTDE